MTPLSGLFYRVKFTADAGRLLDPATSPEGRFHYNGQAAIYLSDTPEGAVIATQTYVGPDDPERAIYPLRLTAARMIDLRDAALMQHLGIDVTHRAARWHDHRAKDLPAPTWPISDRVRGLGADGMIYASRKRPELSHLVLFHWNTPGSAKLQSGGAALPWPG